MLNHIADNATNCTAPCCYSTGHIFSASTTVLAATSVTWESPFSGLFQCFFDHHLYFQHRTGQSQPLFSGPTTYNSLVSVATGASPALFFWAVPSLSIQCSILSPAFQISSLVGPWRRFRHLRLGELLQTQSAYLLPIEGLFLGAVVSLPTLGSLRLSTAYFFLLILMPILKISFSQS